MATTQSGGRTLPPLPPNLPESESARFDKKGNTNTISSTQTRMLLSGILGADLYVLLRDGRIYTGSLTAIDKTTLLLKRSKEFPVPYHQRRSASAQSGTTSIKSVGPVQPQPQPQLRTQSKYVDPETLTDVTDLTRTSPVKVEPRQNSASELSSSGASTVHETISSKDPKQGQQHHDEGDKEEQQEVMEGQEDHIRNPVMVAGDAYRAEGEDMEMQGVVGQGEKDEEEPVTLGRSYDPPESVQMNGMERRSQGRDMAMVLIDIKDVERVELAPDQSGQVMDAARMLKGERSRVVGEII